MSVLRSIAITFSLYSRIPMPKFDWKDRDMRYSIAVFPWVGFVIGIVYYLIFYIGRQLNVPDIALAMIMTAAPVIITGGFHLDGYMDTKDALNSYKPREEKLKILKDPHTGAFAVIWLVVCILIFAAMQVMIISEPNAQRIVWVSALSFFLARCQSAVNVIILPPAKKDGMLHHESREALKARKRNLMILGIESALAILFMLILNFLAGLLAVIVTIVWNAVYANRCGRIFGGTTGDTSGYFLVKCELYIAVVIALVGVVF